MNSTEKQDARYAGLDQWDDLKILEALQQGQLRAVESVRHASGAIAAAAQALAKKLAAGGRLIYAGAGSSISIAVQDGAELPGTFGLDRHRLVFLIAGGPEALIDIAGGAEDNVDAAVAAIEAANITAGDSLIAVSASGTTPYTLAAAYQAKVRNALVVGIANNAGSQLLRLADCPILLESGHEVIAGSTRMGAGTAQKAALNFLSTLTQIKLGNVIDGMMINVRADNAKLRKRAAGIVARIAGVDEQRGVAALERCKGDVRLAVLICAGAGTPSGAQALLDAAHGNLRLALKLRSGAGIGR